MIYSNKTQTILQTVDFAERERERERGGGGQLKRKSIHLKKKLFCFVDSEKISKC